MPRLTEMTALEAIAAERRMNRPIALTLMTLAASSIVIGAVLVGMAVLRQVGG